MVPSTLNCEKAKTFVLMPLFLYCIMILVIFLYTQKQTNYKYDDLIIPFNGKTMAVLWPRWRCWIHLRISIINMTTVGWHYSCPTLYSPPVITVYQPSLLILQHCLYAGQTIFILPLIHLQCDFIDVSVIEFCKYCSNNTILRITSSIRCHICSITLLCSLSIHMYVCILLCLLWFVDYSSDSVCYQYICLSIIFVCLC